MQAITRQEVFFGLLGLAVLAFFAYLDVRLSNNVAAPISYVSVLGFGLLARSRRLVLLFGLLGVLATIYGYYYPINEYSEIDITNRQLAMIAIMTITITSHIYMTRQEEFDQKLYRISITDELTGIANRRALLQELEKRITEAMRYRNQLSVLLFDLDDFKDINDRHGHLVGDFILKRLTRICQSWLRTTDYIGRYGGEEFLVVCPNTTLEGAKALAERIRIAVEQADFIFRGIKHAVTISIGVTELSNHLDNIPCGLNEIEISHNMIDAADSAMYRAKRTGKNCTVAYEPIKTMDRQSLIV